MYIGIVILIKFASSTRVPSISVEHFSNGAQFLNTTCVAASSGCFLWEWVPAGEPAGMAIVFVTVLFPVTKYMHQNNHDDLILLTLLKTLLDRDVNNYLLTHSQ